MPDEGRGHSPDDHYQPWLKHQSAGGIGPAAVNRPRPLPTKQAAQPDADPSPPAPARPALDMSVDELLARPIALPGGDGEDSPGIVVRIGTVASAVRAWTGEVLERADIGGRIARLQPADRAQHAAHMGAVALRSAARATAKGAEQLASFALPRLRAMAEQTRSGLSAGAGSASRILADGGRRLAASVHALPAMTRQAIEARRPSGVASQLDRLIVEEELAQSPPATSEQSLPLFQKPAEPPPSHPPAPSAAMSAAQPQPLHQAVAPATRSADHKALPGGSGGGSGGSPEHGSGEDRWLTTAGWLRHPASWVAGGVALLLSGFVVGMMWDGGSNRAVTERIIHDYLLNNPEILPQAMEKLQANRVAAAISEQRTAIETPFSGAWAGAADGDVTLTVFTDYACTYCRASVADIDRLLREDRRLKIVFRELPILSEDSEDAARFALVAARSGRYMAVHRALFAAGAPDESRRSAVASQFSINAGAAALADPAITRELRNNLQMARALGVDATPSWVVGDTALTGAVGYGRLRQAIAAARSN